MPPDIRTSFLLNRLVPAAGSAALLERPAAFDAQSPSEGRAAAVPLLNFQSGSLGQTVKQSAFLWPSDIPGLAAFRETESKPRERTVLLFSHEQSVFHALDDGLKNLPGYAVRLDWISNEEFNKRSVIEAEYDLIFIDYRFGYRLGVEEQLEILRRVAASDNVPLIVVITAKEHLRLTLQALQAGAVDYLFRDELGSTLLKRMLQYASPMISRRANRLYERPVVPARDAVTAALEEAVEEHDVANASGPKILRHGFKQTAESGKQVAATETSLELSVLLNALPHAVFWRSESGTFLACNSRFARLLGAASAEDVIGTTASDWSIDLLLSKDIQGGEPGLIAWPQITQGRRRWYQRHTTSLYDESKEPMGTFVVLEDVTCYLGAQKALRESELRLRSVMSQLPVEVWTIDSELRLYLSNHTGELKLSLNKTSTKRPLTLYEYFSAAGPDARAVRAAEQALRGESVSFRHRQDNAEYLVQMQPFRDASGTIIGAVGVTVNVSERIATEDQRHQPLEHESLAALARGIAHDFNNLLLGIVGNAGMVALDLEQNVQARERLHKITQAAQCASDLTSQLLSHAGQIPQEKTNVDLSALATEVCNMLEGSIIATGLMTQERADSLPGIEGDPSQIKQVVMNFLTNAADAVGECEGRIILRTGLAEPPPFSETIRVGSDTPPQGAYVYLSVEDTGPGIDDAVLRRIFDPFYTTKVRGRGLGLATVLGIVRNHNGFLEVESLPGRSTTFRAYFPVGKI